MPLIAPVGAAAYTVRESKVGDKDRLSVLFAMMRENETGRATIVRVMKEAPNMNWKAVDAYPANQTLRIADSPDAVAYDFTRQPDGSWRPDKDEAAAFLEQVTRLVSSSTKAPASITVTLKDWATDNTANKKQ